MKRIRIVGVLPIAQPTAEGVLEPPSVLEWIRHLDIYEGWGWARGWIPIRPLSKEPYRGEAWTEQTFDRSSIQQSVAHGGNLAIVAGKLGYVVLDLDVDQLPSPFDPSLTLTQRTSRGYQFFTGEPFDQGLFNRLKELVPQFDVPRMGPMYAVVPLSRTCVCDHGKRHDCRIHDLRTRTWIGDGMKAKAVRFSEFARMVLK